ncbi:hypothetical protein MUK42_16535 [Musa troglodytarum]|uniref:Uncharacterized protein n=1 Tax=Musa troglodytarum TaxID=320322 RepID=A0A9E7KVZ7_9LILI|nr:hypothetical protein MUK42_16535 [Musa troglodytarum]
MGLSETEIDLIRFLLDINKQHPDQVDPEEVTRKAQEEDPSSIEQLVSYTSSSPGLRRRAS